MSDYTDILEGMDDEGIAWLEEKPAPGECIDCGAEVPPAEHPSRDLWLAPQKRCYECDTEEKSRQSDAAHRRELFEPRFRHCGAGKWLRSEAKRLDVDLPDCLQSLIRRNPDAPGKRWGVFLWGPTEGGKSTMSVKAIGRFHKRWIFGLEDEGRRDAPVLRTARYVNMPSVFQEAVESFDDDSSDFSWRELKEADLLVMDEVGRERQDKSWVTDIVYGLVNHRYEQQKLTIFTSNFGPAALTTRAGEVYDERTVRRIMDICGAQAGPASCYFVDRDHELTRDAGEWGNDRQSSTDTRRSAR